ncbi:MAG: S8 family peptidase, partial [Candidatus Aenigmatarchaeota archaeon]
YMDYVGHGTGVAGIIAAEENGFGLIGVAPKADLYAVKIATSRGAYLNDILKGLNWCLENDMDIVVMSFGSEIYDEEFENKVRELYSNGILLVSSAGNGEDTDGNRIITVNYPARFEEVIAVSAVDERDQYIPRYSYGPEVEISAPGYLVYTTSLTNGYMVISGTSFSAPHVAGALALILSYNNSLTPEEIRKILRESTIDLGIFGKDNYYGYGRLDLSIYSSLVNNNRDGSLKISEPNSTFTDPEKLETTNLFNTTIFTTTTIVETTTPEQPQETTTTLETSTEPKPELTPTVTTTTERVLITTLITTSVIEYENIPQTPQETEIIDTINTPIQTTTTFEIYDSTTTITTLPKTTILEEIRSTTTTIELSPPRTTTTFDNHILDIKSNIKRGGGSSKKIIKTNIVTTTALTTSTITTRTTTTTSTTTYYTSNTNPTIYQLHDAIEEKKPTGRFILAKQKIEKIFLLIIKLLSFDISYFFNSFIGS